MPNFSPASIDLGLGDGVVLSTQLKTEEDERKKKLLQMGAQRPSLYGDSVMGLAALDLLGVGGGGGRG